MPTTELRNEGPHYDLDVIGINPAINSVEDAIGLPSNWVVALDCDEDSTQLLSKRQEFVTSPPITAMMVGLRDRLGLRLMIADHTSTAMVRDDSGIRAGLLLDVFDKLRAQALWQLENGLNRPWSCALHPVAFFRYYGLTAWDRHPEGYGDSA